MGQYLDNINLKFERLPDRLRTKRWWIIIGFILLTGFISIGMRNVVIDESLEAYFHKDDPVKQAYDQFRGIFGGDEYVYIVYRAKNGDIFSKKSVAALLKLHHDLADYRLTLTPGEPSALDHIDEVKSLINVKYMEGRHNTLYSKNFIGDKIPDSAVLSDRLRKKALNHPDFPLIYLSENSEYGGIMIRTDFNAETPELTQALSQEESLFDGDAFGDDIGSTVASETSNEPAAGIRKTDIREYPKFMAALKKILETPAYQDAFEFHAVGNPVLMNFFTEAVIQDMGRLMSLVLLLVVIMLWLLFRSLSAVLWPVLIVCFTIVWIMGTIGWTGISMSAMVQVIIFLALTVGIADSVHILSGYLFFRNQGLEHSPALRAVMKKSGLACLLTSITTAIGLLSLVFVPLKPISSFGIFAAVAVLFAFLFTVILLPLMLDLWSPVSKKQTIDKDHLVLKILKQVESVGYGHYRLVLLIFSGFALFLFFGLAQLKVDSNFVEIIKKGMPLRDAYTLVDKFMGGTGNMEVMIDFKKTEALKDPKVLSAMQDLQTFMEENRTTRVVKTMSLVNVVKESYKVLNDDDPAFYTIPKDPAVLKQVLFLFENANPKDRTRLVTDDYAQARIGLNSVNVGSIEALEIMEAIQTFIDTRFLELKTAYPDLEVTLTGNMALLAIMLDYLAWAQIKSFGIALIVISIVLFLVLGSSKAGLVALAPNLFPILTSFGLMGFFKIPLDADTLIVAPIIIGLAVDDTIHFLTHFRIGMAKTKNIAAAVVESIRESGQAITFTSLILSSGFLVFILSFHNGISRFGIFAAIAILTALVCDIFLLPALCRVCNVNFNRKIAR